MRTPHDSTAITPRARVLLVDDHPIVRHGLARLIDRQANLAVCAEVATVAEALAAVESAPPDVAIVDLMLEGGSGIDLIRALHLKLPALPILVLSMHEENLYAERALRAGARGYVTKREPPDAILRAILRVLQGELAFSPAIIKKLESLQAQADADLPLDVILAGLSDRELDVFQYLRQGYSRRQTAEMLQCDVETIHVHCATILAKLHLEDLNELAPYFLTPGHEAVPPVQPAPVEAHYLFEDYVLDTGRRELYRRGALIPLEPKVYQVLLYLAQHADRLVTRDELLAHIWPDVFVQDAVVSRCIREVRQALGDDRSTQRMIQTRPGQGYRFVPSVIQRDMRGQQP